ncbi:MAG: hypothetical protein ABS942_15385 [Solibacillus sp.]|uniref:hypothetical protein n=1 Tax=unclassified Solibacillus TaxID=2637870 RepID=UPI00310104D2
MQPVIKKIEALALSISVQSGVGIIETISEKDGTKKAIFKITAKTPLMTKDGHQIGASAIPVKGRLIAFVDSSIPLPMQAPPQTEPLLVIFDQYDKKGEVAVGVFNEMLFSEQLNLKLHVKDSTEIVDLQGKRVEKEGLYRKVLIVLYEVTTRSRPTQTNPTKIIVTNVLAE